MKVLVTGGSGFIGSNFINFVLNDEEEIILIIDDTCKFKVWGERNNEGTMILRHDTLGVEDEPR